MTARPSIFREEALEFRAAGDRASGEPLRVDSSWLRWSYWAVLALLVAGLATTMIVRTDATATGPAVVQPDGTFVALIPAAVGPQLEGALAVRIESSGGADHIGAAAIVHDVDAADDGVVSRMGLPAPLGPSLMVSGALVGGEPSAQPPRNAEVNARVVVVLRSEPILAMFTRRIRGMFG
jgi:hypothetical protein